MYNINNILICGSVVEHCVSSTNGCGFNSQGTHTDENKSLWIKASAKCINVNVNKHFSRYSFSTQYSSK